jgi:hypothetical protein
MTAPAGAVLLPSLAHDRTPAFNLGARLAQRLPSEVLPSFKQGACQRAITPTQQARYTKRLIPLPTCAFEATFDVLSPSL